MHKCAFGFLLLAFFECQEVLAHPPTGIVVDKEGSIYFLKFLLGTKEQRSERSQLWKLDPDGTLRNIPVTIDGRKLSRPHKLAIDRSHGSLYLSGGVKVAADETVSKVDYLKWPPAWASPLAADRQGNLYYFSVGDRAERSKRLRMLVSMDPRGDVHLVAGSTEGYKDGTGDEAQFVHIEDMAVGPSGDLYVADGGRTGSWIRRVTRNGTVTTIAGSEERGFADGRGDAAHFRRLAGMSTDQEGNLYVADRFDRRIRKVTPDGLVTTFAGTGDYGDTDGPAADASFAIPSGVAVGPEGNVYVLDGTASITRIRKISPDGNVETIAVIEPLPLRSEN